MKLQARWLLVALAACQATATFAGFGGMDQADGDGSGPITLFSVFCALAFFGGIVFFLSRFKNEMQGFAWLVGGIVLVLAFGALSKCSG